MAVREGFLLLLLLPLLCRGHTVQIFQRSHHRRPVERRDVVVQIICAPVALQVRLDRLLVEVSLRATELVAFRGSAGRGVFDVVADGTTAAQHPL